MSKIEKKLPKVYILLVNYNNHQDTIECLESIKASTYRNIHIILVDNCSTNDSMQHLANYKETEWPAENLTIIPTKYNKGFAGGNNVGLDYFLEKADSDFILLLNNDTTVTPNFLSPIIEEATSNPLAFITTGSISYYSNKKRYWYNGGKYNKIFSYVTHSKKFSPIVRENVSFASGCFMLLTRTCIQNIGKLNEDFFMYYEDLDYCHRVRLSGKKIIIRRDSLIFHKVGASNGSALNEFSAYWMARNRVKFIVDNLSFSLKIIALSSILLSRLVIFPYRLLTGNHNIIRAQLKGYADAIGHK